MCPKCKVELVENVCPVCNTHIDEWATEEDKAPLREALARIEALHTKRMELLRDMLANQERIDETSIRGSDKAQSILETALKNMRTILGPLTSPNDNQ